MTTPWQRRYAQRNQRMGGSIIRELLKFTQQPDMISFAGGLPAPELFPVEAFRAAADRVLTQSGSKALQYSTTEGYQPLRALIVEKMAHYGILAKEDNVLITSGSQQALDLIGKLLINAGDTILVERPTYLGALQAWNAYQAEYVEVPIDDNGLQVDQLEEALRAGVKFMYVLPNFQNPGGVTLSLDRRQELVELADRYGVPIIEDDPYGELLYEGEHLPTLVQLDCEHLESRACDGHGYFRGNILYLSTFSKTLAPGLRLGWIVAPVEVIQKCVQAKQGMDLHTSIFDQMVAYEVAKGGFLEKHVRTLRRVYGARRDVMLAAMERYFPAGVHWTHPRGGLFLWVELPPEINAEELLQDAIKEKVAFVPGHAFYAAGRSSGQLNTMRLNFSNAEPEMIEEGIRRLARAIEQRMGGRMTPVVTPVPAMSMN